MRISEERRHEVAKRVMEYDVAEFKESAIAPFLECLGRGYMDWRGILDTLADLIAPRGKDALAVENVERLTRERDEAVAEAAELRERAEHAEAEMDGLRRRPEKVGFLLRDNEEGGR